MTGHATGQLRARVAANIVTAMAEKGITGAALSREMQTSEKAVQRWRNGTITPNEANLGHLARILEVGDPSWFYLDHDSEEAVA